MEGVELWLYPLFPSTPNPQRGRCAEGSPGRRPESHRHRLRSPRSQQAHATRRPPSGWVSATTRTDVLERWRQPIGDAQPWLAAWLGEGIRLGTVLVNEVEVEESPELDVDPAPESNYFALRLHIGRLLYMPLVLRNR
jgi:hypothetical protein